MEQPKPAQEKAKRGFQPKKNPSIRLADPEVLKAVKTPLPTNQIEPVPQSFAGIPPPIDTRQPKSRVLISATKNPLVTPLPKLPTPHPADTGSSLPAPPIPKKKPTPLRLIQKTPNFKAPTQRVGPKTQQIFDTRLSPALKEYQKAQEQEETKNPYLTDTTVYTPPTRKSYYRFISDNYRQTFALPVQLTKKIDEDACAKLGASAATQVEAFLYQKFIREYIRQAGPYRGILVYHGLGSGKTCSSIAAAEALYGTANKKIIVMTPFSLRANFMSEISFCGFRHFNLKNHWISQPLTNNIIKAFAKSVLSLSETYIERLLRRKEEERQVIWVADFTKPSNYDELSAQQRDDIRAQITETIENRITFINYNGIQATKLKEYACYEDPVTKKRFFDDAVVIIDEVHNLTRLMQGTIVPYMIARPGRRRKIPAEPVTPGKWKPKLCSSNMNYKRAFLFYKLLTDARNTKIIGLSGTPIINFPEELGILANVLSGYIECVEMSVLSTNDQVLEQFQKIAEAEPRVDIVRKKEARGMYNFLISVFPEGYEKVVSEAEDVDEEFQGVKYNEEAQQGIQEVYERIKQKARDAKIPISSTEQYVSYPRLPPDDDTFRGAFINPQTLDVKNEIVLKKRLTGLISYYKGSKEEYMPRVIKDELVKCEMSDYTLSKYTVERIREIKGEAKKEEGGDVFADVEMYAKMKNPSSYRFRSRALCNFTFPKGIDRPFPDSQVEEEEEVTQVEDLEMAEAMTSPDEDLAAQEEVAEEEEQIPDPEEEEDEAGEEEGEEQKETAIALERVKEKKVQQNVNKEESEQAGGANSNNENDDEDDYNEEELLKYLDGSNNEASNSNSNASSNTELEESNSTTSNTNSNTESEESNTNSNTESEESNEEQESVPEVKPLVPTIRKRPTIAQPQQQQQQQEPVALQVQSRPLRKRPTVAPQPPQQQKPVVELPEPENIVSENEDTNNESVLSTISDGVGAVVDAVQEQVVTRTLTYQERIKRAMQKLNDNRASYLKLDSTIPEGRLAQYSTKLDQIIRRIMVSKGSNLVYSQFKTVEGLGVLGVALKANGFTEIVIEGSDLEPRFSEATEASLRKGPQAREKRFITFSGEGSRERRGLILNVFNGNFDKLPTSMRDILVESGYQERKNNYGEICWVIGITGAGAEGISLKSCRSVHIMEPYWNNVRLKQVQGRAIRICSHSELPYAEREVELYTYVSVFSRQQIEGNKIDMTLKTTDETETSDEKVYNVSSRKEKLTESLLRIMKETAVDCQLNAPDNEQIACFEVDGRPDQYMFDPDLATDIINTSIEVTEDKKKQESLAPTQAALGELKEAKPAGRQVQTVEVPVIEWEGQQYMIAEKPKTGGLVFNLFEMTDLRHRYPVGEISVSPVDGSFEEPNFYKK